MIEVPRTTLKNEVVRHLHERQTLANGEIAVLVGVCQTDRIMPHECTDVVLGELGELAHDALTGLKLLIDAVALIDPVLFDAVRLEPFGNLRVGYAGCLDVPHRVRGLVNLLYKLLVRDTTLHLLKNERIERIV